VSCVSLCEDQVARMGKEGNRGVSMSSSKRDNYSLSMCQCDKLGICSYVPNPHEAMLSADVGEGEQMTEDGRLRPD
jgi:hypothetical protein